MMVMVLCHHSDAPQNLNMMKVIYIQIEIVKQSFIEKRV